MKNKVITSQGNVQFIFPDGKIVNVHPNHIYTAFNEDTVSFILVALPKSSGLALMTSKAEDLELNGETYSFAELPAAMSEAFAIAGAQARCEIVDELPETGYTNTIYLVPQPSPQTGFDEYVYILDQGWELIGDTSIEMANYVTKTVFSGYTASTAAELSGKAEVVEITQANYDLLPSSAKTDASKLYVISDAQPIDLSVYAKTSAVTSADTALDNKIDAVSGATDAALALKQNILTAGTGIAITTGETANTVSLDINAKKGSSNTALVFNYTNSNTATAAGATSFGYMCKATNQYTFANGNNTQAKGYYSHSEGETTIANGRASHSDGQYTNANGKASHTEGSYVNAENDYESSQGRYNVSNKANTTWGDSGNTLFSVGNGTANNARHNAFEIRQNGDIYISLNGQDVKLQDQLGGGGSSYSAGDGIDITNDVISVTGKVSTSDFNTYSGNVDTALSGKANSEDVYTKSETSGATQIANALRRKVDSINDAVLDNGILRLTWNGGLGSYSKLFGVGSGLSLTYNINSGVYVLSLQDELEETIARALNDLNDRITAIESRLNN